MPIQGRRPTAEMLIFSSNVQGSKGNGELGFTGRINGPPHFQFASFFNNNELFFDCLQ